MLLNCGVKKTIDSLLNSKEIKPVDPKGNQSWIFIGRTDAEGEALVTWCKEPTHSKRPNAGKDWRQKEKGIAEGEMVR